MSRWLGWTATALALVEMGWILGSTSGNAVAQEPPPHRDLRCKAFVGSPDRPGVADTSDRTTEIGQWVADGQTKGWEVATVDFEVGTKATGYPQPWVEVCLSR
jgi:hypothetical protein